MKLSEVGILHITNNLEYGGVQKIIYQLCNLTSSKFNKVVVASAGGVYVERLNEIGVEHINLPDLSTKNIIEILKIIRTIKRIVRDYNIKIIHCHHRMAVLFSKCICSDVIIIYNNHTIYSDKAKLSHYILKNVNIIADGELACENVTDFFGISKKNTTVINNAVDAFDGGYDEITEIARERDKGNFIVMNCARLHPQKGMKYFIDAAEILIKKGLTIKFFIVGDGPLHGEVVDRIKEKKLEEYIILLGFRKDIKNTISQSDILVLTSLYEGLPLTPMEAFSVNVPVVATDIDGTREVVENKYNGLLCETMNPIAIADGIEKLYLNREMLQEYRDNAYKTYLERFSLQPFSKAYIEYYKNLMGKQKNEND